MFVSKQHSFNRTNVFVNSDSYTTDEMNLSWFEGLPVAYSDDFVSLVSRIDSTVTTKCSGQSGPHDGEGLVWRFFCGVIK